MPDTYAPTPERPGRILAVDDLVGNLKVLGRELRGLPFELHTAGTAAEAIDLCAAMPFEGILMDVSLPGMDGIEACRRIRAAGANAATPLIFLSAVRIGDDWVREGIESGGIDYLTKPYRFPELHAKLIMMVRLSRQREAALEGERHRALLEVAGGAAHELSQPLASAGLLLEQILACPGQPPARLLEELRAKLEKTETILHQIQNLHRYITKPYADGRILDLARSSRSPITDQPDQD